MKDGQDLRGASRLAELNWLNMSRVRMPPNEDKRRVHELPASTQGNEAHGKSGIRRSVSPTLFALVALAVATALLVCLGSTVWGHWYGMSAGLNLYDSYITEYMKLGPNWRWLTVASFAFAVLLYLLALGYVLRRPPRLAMVFGSPMTLIGAPQ